MSVTDRFAVREPVAAGRKVTLMLQFAPAARVVPQVVVLAKSAALVPVNAMLVMLMVAFPVFDKVTARELLVVLITCAPNAREVGDSCAAGLVPVPVSGTVCGLPLALSATETEALRAVADVGVKVTLMVQFAPAARVVPHVFVCAKSPGLVPVIDTLVIVKVAFPVLDRVIGCAALVVFIGWFANATDVGANVTTAAPVEVKLVEPTFALVIVTVVLVGVKAQPVWTGVTVYDPLTNPGKL